MTNPLISIITPCFNGHHYIAHTLKSVLAQTYTHWELIIIDDHSSDQTLAVVEELAKNDARVQVVRLLQNSGPAKARNVGLDLATGNYIAFLDSDDLWMPNKLERQLAFMEHQNARISFTAFCRMDENGVPGRVKNEVPQKVNYQQLLSNNVIACSSAMYCAKTLGKLRFVNMGHEDFLFWLNALKMVGHAQGLNEVLLHYRIRKGSISSNKWQAAGFTWNVYRKGQGFGLPKTIWLFMAYVFHALRKRI